MWFRSKEKPPPERKPLPIKMVEVKVYVESISEDGVKLLCWKDGDDESISVNLGVDDTVSFQCNVFTVR